MELPRQRRSQMEFGNEEKIGHPELVEGSVRAGERAGRRSFGCGLRLRSG